ncbi:hypothetical protein V5799_027705 [Amblyomma americanum]|uniref:Transposable element P transposase-like RNase H domain-containing protein n=1 Tax=Amblyomma americanum TaxID=6943 RepID=A0AAQ4DEY8_AMBAM
MTLPGRKCLQKYLQRFKGGFGLNEKVFAILSEKTKSMDTFSRHGDLLVDEIKLSEHLSVKAAGNIEGFVDLGDYTTSDHKGVLADHGMIVLFQPYTGLSLLNTGSPTRISASTTPTAIDLTLVSQCCEYSWRTEPDTEGSDHFLIDKPPPEKKVHSVISWSRFRDLCSAECEPSDFFVLIRDSTQSATTRCAVALRAPVPDVKLLNLRAARRKAQLQRRRARRTNKP